MLNKYFKREEFACKCGCGMDTVDVELLKVLTGIRKHFNKPVEITSGNRCCRHNALEGGAEKSSHLKYAADIKVRDIPSNTIYAYLDKKYPKKYGIGKYKGRTHVDIRETKARWEG